MNHLMNWLRIGVAVAIMGIIACNSLIHTPAGEISKDIEVVISTDTLSMRDSVEIFMKEINLGHAEIAITQAALESAHFTSDIFKENNNLFGMKKAYHRPHVQTGVNRGHATYDNWRMSVIDYALYQIYVAKGLTTDEYQKFIGKHYAEDPIYSQKIK